MTPAWPLSPARDKFLVCNHAMDSTNTHTHTPVGEVVVPQVDIHAPWGGVVPKLAQQAHAEAMDSAIASALASASVRPETLSGVAVTIGPGLSLCLHVGVRAAHALARSACVPFVPVHHMEAHALVARAFDSSVRFPFLCLLVSGGHNLLLVVHGVGHYTQLGTTLDDALGEAYDKVARLLGLPLTPSGGAALEQLALQGDAARFALPLPLKKHADCNFSYAGLKTAVRLLIEAELGGEDCLQTRADIAASFQRVAVQHLAQRTARGVQWARDQVPALDTLVVAGGVAANATVRAQLLEVAQDAGLRLVCPPPRYCTDNGVMVAWAGIERSANISTIQLLHISKSCGTGTDWACRRHPRSCMCLPLRTKSGLSCGLGGRSPATSTRGGRRHSEALGKSGSTQTCPCSQGSSLPLRRVGDDQRCGFATDLSPDNNS